MPMTYSIVEPEEIGIPEEKKDQIMEVDLPQVPLHPADFVWMVPYEGLEGKQVAMGVRLVGGKDNEVLVEGVTPGSPAEKAGILKGDRLFSFDGRIVSDVTDVFLNVREKKAGDKATVVVRRDGAEKSVEVEFFPLPGKKPHE
jgi:S1-C subfamily serine protease